MQLDQGLLKGDLTVAQAEPHGLYLAVSIMYSQMRHRLLSPTLAKLIQEQQQALLLGVIKRLDSTSGLLVTWAERRFRFR